MPWIEGEPLTDDLALCAEALLATFPEHIISTSPELGFLIPGKLVRHARVMHHSAQNLAKVALPDGLFFAPLIESDADRFALASDSAYPPEHPDWNPGQVEQSVGMIKGELVGALNPASTVTVNESGEIVAGAIVTNFPMPWLGDFFRTAHAPRGTAEALMVEVLRKSGPLLLAVTESNTNAITFYERLGFTTQSRSVTVRTGRNEA